MLSFILCSIFAPKTKIKIFISSPQNIQNWEGLTDDDELSAALTKILTHNKQKEKPTNDFFAYVIQ